MGIQEARHWMVGIDMQQDPILITVAWKRQLHIRKKLLKASYLDENITDALSNTDHIPQ